MESAMPDEPAELARINITYRRDLSASEAMTLSDGAGEVVLYLSPLGGMNMLLEVIDALLQLLPYRGEHIYYWEGDQDYYRWRFQLDGDTLHIEVTQLGETLFSTTCSVWQFAAKLRLCASRLAVAEDTRRPNGGDWVRRDTGYQQLSALLAERKSTR
jgi:hypothetical protein